MEPYPEKGAKPEDASDTCLANATIVPHPISPAFLAPDSTRLSRCSRFTHELVAGPRRQDIKIQSSAPGLPQDVSFANNDNRSTRGTRRTRHMRFEHKKLSVPPALPEQIDGIESKDIQTFLESIVKAKATLISDSRSRQKSKARDALKHLYRLNVGNKRIILYTHYMRHAQDSFLPDFNQDRPSLDMVFQDDLEAYCMLHPRDSHSQQKRYKDMLTARVAKATAQYENFLIAHGSGWRINSDSPLIEAAARLTAIQSLVERQPEDQAERYTQKRIIDTARERLADYYSAYILNTDPGLIPITARDSFLAEAPGQAEQEEKEEEARKQKERLKQFWSNYKMAVFGGLALIVPMLIMTLHQTQLTALLTTSLFVLVVAIILSIVMDTAEEKDIVAATAAYAAVLVVFVGTGAGSGSTSSGGAPSNNVSATHGYSELSAGATTGIVVGCIVGVLLIPCFLLSCCSQELLEAFLAIFGIGPRARYPTKEVKIHEEGRQPYYRENGRIWFGNGRSDLDDESEDMSSDSDNSSVRARHRRRYYV